MFLELFPSILKQIQEKNGVGNPISINPLAVWTKNRSSLIEQTTPVALALSDTIAIASWRRAVVKGRLWCWVFLLTLSWINSLGHHAIIYSIIPYIPCCLVSSNSIEIFSLFTPNRWVKNFSGAPCSFMACPFFRCPTCPSQISIWIWQNWEVL